MARRKTSNPMEADDQPKMDISPLIDVAFLLLIYFLVTTTLTKQEADLGLKLPGISSQDTNSLEIDQMLIKVTRDGAIMVNEDVVDTDADDRRVKNLTDRLERYAATAQMAKTEPMVIVHCEREAMNQRFLDVLNACAHVGIKNVSLTDQE